MPLIRSPLDQNGNLRYFELLKIVLIVGLLLVLISTSLNKLVLPSAAAPWVTWLFAGILLTQGILSSLEDARQLLQEIRDFVLKPITFQPEPVLINTVKTIYASLESVIFDLFGPSSARKIRC